MWNSAKFQTFCRFQVFELCICLANQNPITGKNIHKLPTNTSTLLVLVGIVIIDVYLIYENEFRNLTGLWNPLCMWKNQIMQIGAYWNRTYWRPFDLPMNSRNMSALVRRCSSNFRQSSATTLPNPVTRENIKKLRTIPPPYENAWFQCLNFILVQTIKW